MEKSAIQDSIQYEKAESEASHKVRPESTVSHTSMDTLYSDRKDGGGFTSNRSTTSTSSESTTSSSSTSTGSSQASQRPKTSRVRQDQPLRRTDTFFDIDTPKNDYASVIDSLSQGTTEDHAERQKDFDREEDDEETGHLTRADVEADEPKKDIVTLRYPSPRKEEEKEKNEREKEDRKEESKEKQYDLKVSVTATVVSLRLRYARDAVENFPATKYLNHIFIPKFEIHYLAFY